MKHIAVTSLLAALLSVVGGLASFNATAEVAVIVHPSNKNVLDKKFIARIYLGKKKSYPDGSVVLPISQNEKTPVRDEFIEKVVGKSIHQFRSHWSQLMFTGKAKPPKEVGRDDQVKKIVAANPAVIGYINASAVDDTVKVVGQF